MNIAARACQIQGTPDDQCSHPSLTIFIVSAEGLKWLDPKFAQPASFTVSSCETRVASLRQADCKQAPVHALTIPPLLPGLAICRSFLAASRSS